MTRSASFLAALASAAVPGLDPVSTRLVRSGPGDQLDTAWVDDSEGRRWIIQAPRTSVAGAMLEDVAAITALLGRRLDLEVPSIKGHVAVPEGRAIVFPPLPGRPLDFASLPDGLGLAAEVGRALAHVHNLEIALFEEAGRPTYDAGTTRARHLTDLDRAAATGHVPTDLLGRWERSLEDVVLWRFLPTPVHGSFTGPNLLATFDDEDDAGSGRVRAVLGWEESHVGDPAEDLAELVARASPAALDEVLAAYGPSRMDTPDPHLLARARLSSELALVRRLLRAVAAQQEELVARTADQLRALDERLAGEPTTSPEPQRPRHDLHGSRAPHGSDDVHPARDPEVTPDVVDETTSPGDDASGPRPAVAVSSDVATVAMPVADGPDHAHQAEAESRPTDAASGDPSEPDPAVAGPDRRRTPTRRAVHFEIDEAEPLEDAGVLDLHEGASEFVPVERRTRSAHEPDRD